MAITGLGDCLALMSNPKVDAAVLGVRVPDASRYGTLAIGDDGRLLEFSEKSPGAGVINAGVYLFRHRTLAHFPAKRPLSFETEVFPTLLHDAHVATLTVDAPFLDIGTPQSLAEAEAFISQNQPFFTS
jgi:D-glycero-alpha-D-manno-heptose 1-phosphate guanylyltransferase